MMGILIGDLLEQDIGIQLRKQPFLILAPQRFPLGWINIYLFQILKLNIILLKIQACQQIVIG